MRFLRYFLLSFCIYGVVFQCSAQLKPTQERELTQTLLQFLKDQRINYTPVALVLNDTLKKAAKSQSEYMAKIGRLTHDQPNKQLLTAIDRVWKNGGEIFEKVEEVVLESAPISLPLTDEKVADLSKFYCNYLLQNKDLLGPFLIPAYQFIGISIKQHTVSKKFYIALVLGKKGYIQETPLIENDNKILAKAFLEHINELRKSLNLNELNYDKDLNAASQLQTGYLLKIHKLTHEQPQQELKYPTNRVSKVGGKGFELVGENILKTQRITGVLTEETLKNFAKLMFEQWKNSPPHYKNMIDPNYTLLGFDAQVDIKENVFYATTVFGKKGIQISNQLSPNAFGLIKGNKICDTLHSKYMNVIRGMGDNVRFEKDHVMLYFHDRRVFETIFKNEDDGIAVDLIHPNQFTCGRENQLDVSPLYDGILLEPQYKTNLMANNVAKSPYRVITTIGKHPDLEKFSDYSTGSFLIYKGQACIYSFPVHIPAHDYDLKPLTPKRKDNTSVTLVEEGIVETEIIKYDFKTNITQPFAITPVKKPIGRFVSATIKSYSSVEGDSVSNTNLHTERAKWIESHLTKTLAVPRELIQTDARENWDLMRFQLVYLKRDSWSKLKTDSIRKIILQRPAAIPWDSLFLKQRQATATINYFGKYALKTKTESKAYFSLRTAVIQKNAALANKALYVLFDENKSVMPELFEDYIVDYLMAEPSCIVNYSALLTQHYKEDYMTCVRYLYHWLDQAKNLGEDEKSNLIQLYCLLGNDFLNDWDISKSHLSHVVHPEKMQVYVPKSPAEDLMLNIQMTFLQYFGQINDSRNIDKCFNFILNYFSKHNLTPEDDVKLGLFYNNWTAYELTTRHLWKKFKQKEINEDGLFLLVNTMVVSSERMSDAEKKGIHNQAIQLNKKRWCEFINDNFQLKRNPEIKEVYCRTCLK